MDPEFESRLRRQLWDYHGCDPNARYGDDGELQCHACMGDFKRAPLAHLLDLIDRKHMLFFRAKV